MNTPVKYITNKEFLLEIHNSKNSYCFFERPEYHRYDVIVGTVADITPEIVETARAKRASSLSTKAEKVSPDSISTDDLVFRVMTVTHVPVDPTGKRRPRVPGEEGLVRTNFPPFCHYVLRDGVPVEVGRSHWVGSLSNGEFCGDHGRINNRLATMFMLLVDRYSRRGNWRGYCVDESTEALTQRGWLNIDQISTEDIILSFSNGQLTWSKTKSIFRDDYDGNMFRMTVQGMDALVTPGHKFITQTGLKPVEYLLEKDQIILTGAPVAHSVTAQYSDAFVEMVGWVVTEGCYDQQIGRKYCRISVYQNEGTYSDRIRACLYELGAQFSETKRKNTQICFNLTKKLCLDIVNVAKDKVLSMEFILALTQHQKELLIQTMIDADGWRNVQGGKKHLRYCQKDKSHVDAFMALCTLAGYRLTCRQRNIVSFGKPGQIYSVNIFSKQAKHTNVENINFYGAKKNGSIKGRGKLEHPNEPTIPYSGRVWCPETEYGSFMARRNGSIYLTGNTYVDEMRSHALLQLSQIALQFDESKSENPFAFYTTIITNCFRRILNLERRNQHIRDDLLIMSGAAPSYTRQIEHEMEQQKIESVRRPDPSEPKPVIEAPPKTRGRKPKIKPTI